MHSIKSSFDELELYLLELEENYIDTHQDPMETPDDYKFDVRSYCVLSHAAFEEFVENVCVYVLDKVVDEFELNKKISISSLCLMHFKSGDTHTYIDDDKWKNSDRIYDYLLGQFKKIKDDFSKYIMTKNHGVGLKYLKQLLIPLGIDIPLDPIHQTALDQLTKFRGSFAHTSHRAIRHISPNDARVYVYDVYDYMQSLAKTTENITYYKY